jgi:hypothetical protein
LDKVPAIIVSEPDATVLQNDQLMSECRVFGFKPALRREWRDHQSKE